MPNRKPKPLYVVTKSYGILGAARVLGLYRSDLAAKDAAKKAAEEFKAEVTPLRHEYDYETDNDSRIYLFRRSRIGSMIRIPVGVINIQTVTVSGSENT
jgi:hypothetical protein